MRIVCPRCVAQYEVDESAIPETGREVQCANCENIWFQDYIEMLPTDDDDSIAEEDRGVFDDLDGKPDANFYSNRGAGPDAEDTSLDDTEAENADLLADDIDDEDFDEDDDVPATNIPVPPVNEDVLDVLRSEAAFSSARDQLDAAAADALDGDGEAIKSALDDTVTADVEPELDELTAFLDSHTSEDPVEDLPEIDEDVADETDAEAAPSFDPRSDLEAIRSQLDDIGAEQSDSTDYEPNLPSDDPIEDTVEDVLDDTEDTQTEEDEPEYDEPDFDAAALSAALDQGLDDDTLSEDDLNDDFDEEEDGTRPAYRADGGTTPIQDTADDIQDHVEEDVEDTIDEAEADLAAALSGLTDDNSTDDVEDMLPEEETPEDSDSAIGLTAAAAVTGAAAAVGMTRPRASGARTRERTLPRFDQTPKTTETPDIPNDDVDQPDLQDEVAAAVDTSRQADPSRRPKGRRKVILPDVDELDASLRSEADEPRRRDREMMEAHEGELAKANRGGFRRAFIWTLFVIALLIALYVLRPQLVAALPAAAIVLDPYAAAIDSVRGLINGLLG